MTKQEQFEIWTDSWHGYAFDEYGAQIILLWEINESLKTIAKQIKEKND